MKMEKVFSDKVRGFFGGKPKWNCEIRILRELDYNIEELDTHGRMFLDESTGTVRLVSKKYGVNEPAIPYRYFKPCMGFRVIYLYSPFPGVFRPVDYELNTIKSKPLCRAGEKDTEKECIYCKHEKIKKTITFDAYFDKECSNLKMVPICSKHNSALVKARFKVIPEERKEWYAQRQSIRERRKLSDKPKWWQSNAATAAVMGIIFIIFVAVLFIYAPQFMSKMMEGVMEKVAIRMMELQAPRS